MLIYINVQKILMAIREQCIRFWILDSRGPSPTAEVTNISDIGTISSDSHNMEARFEVMA